jgi:hypothetical protein
MATPNMTGSPAGSIAGSDWLKVLKGAGVAAFGAVITYGLTVVLPDLQSHGAITAAMFVMISTAGNALLKFLTDTQAPAPPDDPPALI